MLRPGHRTDTGAPVGEVEPESPRRGHETSLSGWGKRPVTTSHVIAPQTVSELTGLARSDRGRIARGLGRSYGDAAQIAGGTVIDMTALTGFWLDAKTGTLTAAAGTSLEKIIDTVVPSGWFLPVTPGTRHVTVGGAIAADVHGKNHHRTGSFGQYVESLDLVSGEDESIRASPDSEVFAATVGGMGLTGIITRATFRLIPVETSWMSVDTAKADDLESVMAILSEADSRFSYSVAWVDLSLSGRGRGVVSLGEHARAEQADDKRSRSLSKLVVAPPPWMPRVVSRPTVRLFNELWHSIAPRREEGRLEHMDAFFYPLDRIGDWNRLYGRNGFVQYQFVVPDGAASALVDIAEMLARTRTPVALAVLKRLGPSRGGHLSFPMPGWTLAVDMPLGDPSLAGVLDACDREVVDGGGRVYLAKDSRLRAEYAREMYPNLDEWREVRGRLDPKHSLRSNLAQRLELIE